MESGELFANAGVANMLNGDFFAWYLDDDAWRGLASGVETLIAGLSNTYAVYATSKAQSIKPSSTCVTIPNDSLHGFVVSRVSNG